MAFFGLSNPYIAKLNSDGTYSDGFKCSEAVSTAVTPAFNEGALYGDNKLVEYIKEFKNAAVEAGVTSLPIVAANILFGHKVTENSIIYNVDDAANYVGYGFISTELKKGKRVYGACILKRFFSPREAILTVQKVTASHLIHLQFRELQVHLMMVITKK